MLILGYLASLLIGGTLGFFGAGGSILTVPILVYLFHLDVILATTYSLFIVGVTSSFGVFAHIKKKEIDISTAFIFGIPSLFSVFITRRFLLSAIPDIILKIGDFTLSKDMFLLILFAILMVMASYSMIHKKAKVTSYESPHSALNLIIEGLFIGMITALVGAGGGFLIVPILVNLVKLPMKTAVGTSLLISTINSLFGFVFSLHLIDIDWLFLLLISSIAVVGIYIGFLMSEKISGAKLKSVFGWFILLMGAAIILNQILFQIIKSN